MSVEVHADLLGPLLVGQLGRVGAFTEQGVVEEAHAATARRPAGSSRALHSEQGR